METINSKITLQMNQLENALNRLAEALAVEKSDIVRDSVIQRFEFSFELCWKTLKNINTAAGKETYTPKDAFRVGAQTGFIEDPQIWFKYLEARNLASHTYNETEAEQVYRKAKEFLADGRKLLNQIKSKLS